MSFEDSESIRASKVLRSFPFFGDVKYNVIDMCNYVQEEGCFVCMSVCDQEGM